MLSKTRSLGLMEGSQTVVGLSASAHPALWMASRLHHANCFVLLDRSNPHSIAHGKEVAMRFWRLTKLKELRAANPGSKRKLTQTDVQFIAGPKVPQESQAHLEPM